MTASLGALAPIVARKLAEAEHLRCGAAGMWGAVPQLPAAASTEMLRGGTLVAEMKRRSPSGGDVLPDLDCAALGADYEHAGAAAVSVLTDGPDFGGSLQDLVTVRQAVRLPLLRKDFIVDPVQVAEARMAGADWVLLMAAVLDDAHLEACLDAVARAAAHAIVEVHDAAEVARALGAGATCVGVNNRDLRTLRTDLASFGRLRPLIPDDVVVIAESGVRNAGDVRRLVGEGADSVLVGEALLRAASPIEACRELVAAARKAAA